MTGARWQLQALAREGDRICDSALMAMLNRYAELSDCRAPVHEWPAV